MMGPLDIVGMYDRWAGCIAVANTDGWAQGYGCWGDVSRDDSAHGVGLGTDGSAQWWW